MRARCSQMRRDSNSPGIARDCLFLAHFGNRAGGIVLIDIECEAAAHQGPVGYLTADQRFRRTRSRLTAPGWANAPQRIRARRGMDASVHHVICSGAFAVWQELEDRRNRAPDSIRRQPDTSSQFYAVAQRNERVLDFAHGVRKVGDDQERNPLGRAGIVIGQNILRCSGSSDPDGGPGASLRDPPTQLSVLPSSPPSSRCIHPTTKPAGAVVYLINRLPEWPRHHFVNASYSSDSIETKPATCRSGLSGRRGARIPIPPFRTGSVPVAFCELRHGHLHGPLRPASYHTTSVLSSGRVFVTRPIHRCPGRHGHYLGLICKLAKPNGPDFRSVPSRPSRWRPQRCSSCWCSR